MILPPVRPFRIFNLIDLGQGQGHLLQGQMVKMIKELGYELL